MTGDPESTIYVIARNEETKQSHFISGFQIRRRFAFLSGMTRGVDAESSSG